MIVTLIGSARFEPWFTSWSKALSKAGHAVFSLSMMKPAPQEREARIKASDAVIILNVLSYLGEESLAELDVARKSHGKIYFLESWGLHHGITGNHNDIVRSAAAAVGTYRTGSPIATSMYPSPWDGPFFGPAGSLRSEIVADIRAAEEKALLDLAASWARLNAQPAAHQAP
jgi:hypothetical protein